MSEIMRPLTFAQLMEQMLGEYNKQKSIFGIREEKFYRNLSDNRIRLFGEEIDSPIGPAAGPNSQLTQNIVAAYLAGSRFIELKTVQTMDGEELRNCVPRPCINAEDECYNVEWSTELTVQQAFDEYVKAWIILHVLGKEYNLGDHVLFNMSVGYSYDGIKSKKIDDYIEGLKDAKNTPIWQECMTWLKENSPRFTNFTIADIDDISSKVSTSITLSTLHGCPADEIEKIADYLLTEKKIHTYIKCNPTLLGYEKARSIMDEMGYGYVSFDDHHFLEDLQFVDAVAMIKRLRTTAADLKLAFGVKITNTFPVDIKREELPGEEMYMSGRSLFPLSVNVAYQLSKEFDGDLPISYSGGIDRFNISDVLRTGIRPVTMATTILKPGGYERMKQLAQIAEHQIDTNINIIDVTYLEQLALGIDSISRHKKGYRAVSGRKTDIPLDLTDCAMAPCKDSGCPIHQQIPAYLEQVSQKNYAKAFEIIANDNVLPSVTGTICDHQCQNKCTRLDYEDPLQIRNAKKASSLLAQKKYIDEILVSDLKSDAKVVIIGAGPAGLAAATYLRRNGVDVTVKETRNKALGIVSHVIPAFRISDAEVELDAKLAAAVGVTIEYGASADYDVKELKKQYDYVIIATGAWKQGRSSLQVDGKRVIDALDFLEASKKSNLTLELGTRVGIIGGGDVAMDCARAAARNKNVEEATIVYRRTKEFMPAQQEEIELAEEDGVLFKELLSPKAIHGDSLVCNQMLLGNYDASGRRGIVATEDTIVLQFDTVISAVGATVDTAAFAQNNIKLDDRGHVVVNYACETSIADVYVAGDCKAGPKTVVKAMADAKMIANNILVKLGLSNDFKVYEMEGCRAELVEKKGVLTAKEDSVTAAASDASRCLSCSKVCEICTDVCPNRANVTIDLGQEFATDAAHHLSQQYQVIHIDAMCNECGNCGIFCPSKGNPYQDKLTLFASEEDMIDSENKGFLPLGEDNFKVRLDGQSIIDYKLGSNLIPAEIESIIAKVVTDYAYLTR
ncbi:MAG: putative selenate reductase subunit YgfK [Clostridiales Family XIII bacterium]|jgi:putative selenate reductase|nr:putative selenate reductase subunit YgfK [Clostridiales Family XIII bacterium]